MKGLLNKNQEEENIIDTLEQQVKFYQNIQIKTTKLINYALEIQNEMNTVQREFNREDQLFKIQSKYALDVLLSESLESLVGLA